jgi:hypothetical protein
LTKHQNSGLETLLSYKIYSKNADLPDNWNELAVSNIFLTLQYFQVLEKSAPENMICHYIGIFENDCLVGIALSQFLNLNKLESFGERDKCIKASLRNLIFKTFSSHVLFIGNNMLTGQNSFLFSENTNKIQALLTLKAATNALKDSFKKQGLKIHVTIFKDFAEKEVSEFKKAGFQNYFKFSTQPNMVFGINENWRSEQDYTDALSKKYRDQYKRARKKADGIEKRKMPLEEIIKYESEIYQLYFHVARNAAFNTFFLRKNHFSVLKEILKDQFLFYGYFVGGKLIGFNTLIKNGNAMDTYFLGYDETIQREKMLYLNMLYDMIAHSINKGFKEIIFARTALEIKSAVGAKPVEMFGFVQHRNTLVNKKIDVLFDYLEPKTEWQQRNPFKH